MISRLSLAEKGRLAPRGCWESTALDFRRFTQLKSVVSFISEFSLSSVPFVCLLSSIRLVYDPSPVCPRPLSVCSQALDGFALDEFVSREENRFVNISTNCIGLSPRSRRYDCSTRARPLSGFERLTRENRRRSGIISSCDDRNLWF